MDKFVKNFIKSNSVDYGLFWISIVCFITSIFLPSSRVGEYESTYSGRIYYGWEIIRQGWITIFYGYFQWIANILIIYSYLATKKSTKANMIVAIIAFLLAFSSLAIDKIPKYNLLLSPSGSGYDYLNQFLIGFYFWIASFTLLAISSYLKLRKLNSVK